MKTPKPGSILIGTSRPEELRSWYSTLLSVDHGGKGVFDLDGFLLIVDERDDVTGTNNDPGRSILNFHVDDFDAVEAHLKTVGVEWQLPVEDRPGGRFGLVTDPDGNHLQFIQLT
ncbi:VOC family protein [Microlunatus parietis]|uniref:Putative glyoxalase superfamily protein PhnB n=1 Tax=Microlunatus parietis TaxID=682979 RepID=A0A7Y9IF05_9ACTN|nr:VOC family protein [Microlunatus parietis]NYE75624.1 putative glyoxalase superfamily protein PhnB [Microlunatus parietis]